jgi:hypothetical protein
VTERAGEVHQLVRTFHSTCIVSDYERTVDALAALGGLRVLEYSALELVGRRGGMTWIGDGSIEVGQPIVADHAAQRFVDRFGGGMHSLAFQVAHLDATLDHLGSAGVAVGTRPLDWFCFTDPRTTGGLLFEWSQRTVPEDPRTGAGEPPFTVEPLVDVRTQAFAGAVVPDPIEWAETYGEAFGLREAFRDTSAGLDHPVVGLAAPDSMLALYRLPGEASASLWGAIHDRARFHVLGLGVDDLEATHEALLGAGIRVLWRDDRCVTVDPHGAGDVGVVFIEGLLPGDARRPATGQSSTVARA